MKESIEIIIDKQGLKLCQSRNCSKFSFIAKDEKGLGGSIAGFIKEVKASASTLALFIAEELLFFQVFKLPLETADLAEAVGYQLEMATPFADEPTWHSFAAVKEGGVYRVTLYAAQSGYIDVYIREMIEAGFHISGLYPESQRYVNRLNRNNKWGLILPGRFFKAYTFNGASLDSRLLCSSEPSFSEAVEICRTDKIYRLAGAGEDLPAESPEPTPPYLDYIDARLLLEQRPLLKSYNMLPTSYQRPDYLQLAIGVLLVLNLITLLTLGGVKAYKLKLYDDRIDHEIEKIMPKVHEMKELQAQKGEMLKAMGQMGDIGKNFNLIGFLAKLTAVMPLSSYVDQLRLDPRSKGVEIQGYTDDVSALTGKLQEIGDTRLKSTSRRRDKTYFDVEIHIP